MSFQKVLIRPGIDTQQTPTLNEGGWSYSNLIRFRNGLAEKMRGWVYIGGNFGTDYNENNVVFANGIEGAVIRGLHAFQDLDNIDYLAVGSNVALQVYTDSIGYAVDITPIRKTSNLTAPFTTLSSNSTINVTDVANGAVAGDGIYIPSYVALVTAGGSTRIGQGTYYVDSLIDANNYYLAIPLNNMTSGIVTGVTSLFTTTNTSQSVKVTLNSHSFAVGSVYNVYFSTTVGGITLYGNYVVVSVIDANNFTINASSAATSSTTGHENGNLVELQYQLSAGNVSDMTSLGYGTGGYGTGGYGSGSGSYVVPLRNWFLDNFGQNLVALPTNGMLYQWVPPIATGNVATAVTNAPLYGAGMFVAVPQEQVVILGAETGGTQDPLLVRWCDTGVITSWTATVTNQAGSYRLSSGSRIIGGLSGALNSYIWTDQDLWAMVYQGYPFVYGFNTVGHNCGLISPKGAAFYNNAAYWMSLKGYFQYNAGGSVSPVICTIWDWVFTRLDVTNKDKIFAAPNSLFNEMTWFFPSTDSDNPTPGEVDSYAKLNVAEGLWDYGRLVRTAWIDQSILGNPIAAGQELAAANENGYVLNPIFQHEIGYDANVEAMPDVFIQSGYIDIASGEQFIFMDWLIPDFVWKTINSATQPRVTITIYTKYYPGDATSDIVGPFTITPQTQYISFRTRARQMAIKIESDTIDTFWRIGSIRYRGSPAGKV